MSFALHIEIPPEIVDTLKDTDYKLCIAQIVKGQCKVICNGNKEYLHRNEFVINDKLSWTTHALSGSYRHSSPISNLTRSLSAIASANPNAISKQGEYKMIAFGVRHGWFDTWGSYTRVFISEFLCTPGSVLLDPHKSFMIWFEYAGRKKNAIVVDFEDGEMAQTVCYNARPGQAGNGSWAKGSLKAQF